MTTSPVPASARRFLLLICATFAALAGCSTTEPKRTAAEAKAPAAPAAAPATPIANFAPALRCMDVLLLDHGVRDLSVMVEDLADPAQRQSAGTRELLMSALSDMTQRSRAIRVIASGKEWGNTASAMAALKREPFAVVPQYALRGAVSLQDNQSVRRGGETIASAVLGIDLTLLTTQDFSVVPGIASRNSGVLFKQGRAYDGRAELQKFGVNFGLTSASATVVGDTSRALLELASIELFGRLARVPYWTCLGMTQAHAGVSAEIQDWFDAMAVRQVDLIKYFQSQLRLRRVYEGPIDGANNAQFKDGVVRYREALGLSSKAELSLDFFKAYLGADHLQIATTLAPAAPPPTQVATVAPLPPAASEPVAPIESAPAINSSPAPTSPRPAAGTSGRPASGSTTSSSLSLRVATGGDPRFAPGRAVQLTIQPSRAAHVYCFIQDKDGRIQRFFPNRWQRDSRVLAADGVKLPGKMGFEIAADGRETVACFATDKDVMAQLPDAFRAGDFDSMPVASLDEVRSSFARAASGALAHQTVLLQPTK